ncbi:methionyl-tRNA formyltransferase [Prochlorococcus marinus]|uniref:methionyl-tRNA formyltransferase n=1 Tax=Prochlorococcus marinus TaxID=1219 RepID=UPI001F1AF04E|nr:formyltransferase family protein [Prochlorococcus marinus]
MIGCVEFTQVCLQSLIDNKWPVAGLITKKKSIQNSDFIDLSVFSRKNNIPIHITENGNDINTEKWLRTKNPDYLLCLGWSHILSKTIIEIPCVCTIGYHPSYLPKNRGRHPLIWALILGLDKTGSTFFRMNEECDSGDIIHQKAIDILCEDNARSLYNRIGKIASQQLLEIMHLIQNKQIIYKEQNPEEVNYWRKRSTDDGLIDWRMSSQAIYNLVRALSEPYPYAHFTYKGKSLKILSCKIHKNNNPNIIPGTVLEIMSGSIIVKTFDSSVECQMIGAELNLLRGATFL